MSAVQKGTYRHYKGSLAKVVGVANHSETLEELVIYEHPNERGEITLWVRPKDCLLKR